MRKIITHHEFPPIPDRQFDWCAYWDGEEETQHCGWGRTEAEAVADLRRLDQERGEAEMSDEEWAVTLALCDQGEV